MAVIIGLISLPALFLVLAWNDTEADNADIVRDVIANEKASHSRDSL